MDVKRDEKILELANILKNTKYLVFFGGAGTSTDSGVKDFRGKNGLYKTLYKEFGITTDAIVEAVNSLK